MSNYDKLKTVLKEVFQLDQADLDFGIYRIMNQKRDEINDFLDNRLLPQVKQILQSTKLIEGQDVKAELKKVEKQLSEMGVVHESSPKYIELKEKLAKGSSIEALEQEIYSNLANFFKRYYKDGDFISLRRYKKDVYAIPYEGEEVKLHWANHDQYYIKTSEYLKNYAFKSEGKTIKFELIEASTEQNNNKEQSGKERRFDLYYEEPIKEEGETLIINLTYDLIDKKDKQEKLLATALETVLPLIPVSFSSVLETRPTEKNKKRTLLEKHLRDFTARNTFDYFIHKDLGGFLRRELDFYIKNEILFIDDINTDNEPDFTAQLAKIRALKQVGEKLITFLAQLEDFQKKLWLKKKFVVESNYCITLDKIPEEYYSEIAKNKAQQEEWVQLFCIDELVDYSVELDELFLKAHPFLVLDTKFFTSEFKDKVLAEFNNLDEETGGLLINSENFQALNLLQERYRGKIETTYIDPPYNTNSSPIAYKNGFKDSSWLSLIENRVSLSKNLMSENSIIEVAIDDIESNNLGKLLDGIFRRENYISQTTVLCNPQGRVANKVSKNSDFHYVYALDFEKIDTVTIIKKDENKKETPLKRTGTNSRRIDRPNRYYPILEKDGVLSMIKKDEYEKIFNHSNRKFDDDFVQELIEKYSILGYNILLPRLDTGEGLVWQRKFDRVSREIDTYIYRNGSIYTPPMEEEVSKTCWMSNVYSNPKYGTERLKEIFNRSFSENTSKSVYTVMDFITLATKENQIIIDYFGGSGTTAHAVIKSNREDRKNRKYILVEMGSYFDSLTFRCIQKVIYTDNWKDGKPQDEKGLSHMFKYMVLESYEDTLNNLSLVKSEAQKSLLNTDAFGDEYILSYMLDVESKESLLDIEAFKKPFEYKLKITANNEIEERSIDLVETFNYLIGLTVQNIETIKGIKILRGINNKGERSLILWRNIEETSNADLNAFFKKQAYNAKDREFDRIYVNGDNNLENLKTGDESWKVKLIEEEFKKQMFDVKDVI